MAEGYIVNRERFVDTGIVTDYQNAKIDQQSAGEKYFDMRPAALIRLHSVQCRPNGVQGVWGGTTCLTTWCSVGACL